MPDIRDAVVEWAEARRATTDAPIADVRKDETFRAKLDRLASAEQNLMRWASLIAETRPSTEQRT